MKTIPPQLELEATSLWIVDTYLHHTPTAKPLLFRSLDEASQYIYNNVAQNVPFKADIKNMGSDDSMSLPGTITGLIWDCPLRMMTKEECLATRSQFAQEWIKSGNHPNIADLEKARRQQIEFVDGEVTMITIYRVSRYLGYLRRASVLNDKTKDIDELIQAWQLLPARLHSGN